MKPTNPSRTAHLTTVASTRLRSFLATTAAITCLVASPSFGDDVRVSWDDGGADNEFTNPLNWVAFADPTPPGGNANQLPGYEVGAPSNAIIQGAGFSGANAANLGSDFTPAVFFNPLIVRAGSHLNIAANLNIAGADFLAGQTGTDNIITHTAGTATLRSLAVGNTAEAANTSAYTLSGTGVIAASNSITINDSATFTIQGDTASVSTGTFFTMTGTSALDYDFGATGVNAISVGGTFGIDTASTLSIDGSSYTGGAAIIDLVTFGSNSTMFTDPSNITISGFTGFDTSVGYDADSMFLSLTAAAVPEASEAAVILLGMTGLLTGRRRKTARA